MKKNTCIEIVITNTVGLNIMAAGTILKIKKALSKNFEHVSTTLIETQEDLNKLIARKPDLVFSGVKYIGFDKQSKKRLSKTKIWLSTLLNQYGINHTGSTTKALKLELNKFDTKVSLKKKGIKSADFFTAKPGQFKNLSMLPLAFPLFIKPICEGSGRGIDESSVIRTFQEFETKVLKLFKIYKSKVLVEKYLSGREFTVAIINCLNSEKLEAFPVEIIAQVNSRGDRILGRRDKVDDSEQVVEIKEKNIHIKVSQFAKKIFTALGARDYGRIDIRMDQNNKLYFLEANLVPGISGGYFTRAFKMIKKQSYSKMINRLVETAIGRTKSLNQLHAKISTDQSFSTQSPLSSAIITPKTFSI